jgi:muramidase (phage lysozyme)
MGCRITPEQAGGANRCAFLDMIAASEIGPELLAVSDDGYNVLVGSTSAHPLLFHGYGEHPNVLTDLGHGLKSTAAGRYQILYRFWTAYRDRLRLPDFSPLSQDLYALRQLKERSALPLIDAGDVAAAVTACAPIWASLPGAGYGQHEQALEHLVAAYRTAGGTVA